MAFPQTRPRRLRRTETLRRMVRETRLTADQFILPFFVVHGKGKKIPVRSMPGVCQLSIDHVVKEAREAHRLGIPAVILFGIPAEKDEEASEAYAEDGIVQRAVKELKSRVPGLVVITDVCLCEYTHHGHCGIVRPHPAARQTRSHPLLSKERDGERSEGYIVDNDASLELLTKTAVSHAESGADIVAPSDMMDGRVQAIRRGLDDAGFSDTPIMSYAVKHASAFYGPFREAAGSAPKFGDRRSYQMDLANAREAIREARADAEEGADILMVKPAGPSLDIIAAVRCAVNLPIAAYQVSGEYAMLQAAAAFGWLNYDKTLMESLTAIRRAGADLIVTYAAREAVRML